MSSRQFFRLLLLSHKVLTYLALPIIVVAILYVASLNLLFYFGKNYLEQSKYDTTVTTLEQLTNMKVSFSSIAIDYDYLLPAIIINELSIVSQNNAVAIVADKAVVRVKLLKSFLQSAPVLKELVVENALVQLKRSDKAQSFDLRLIEKLLLLSSNLQINRGTLELLTIANKEINKVTIKSARIRNNNKMHQLAVLVSENEHILFQLNGSASKVSQLSGKGYLKLHNNLLASPILSLLGNEKIKNLKTDHLEMWLDIAPQWKIGYKGVVALSASINAENLKLTNKIQGRLSDGIFQSYFLQNQITYLGEQYQLPDFTLKLKESNLNFKLLDSADLSTFNTLILNTKLLPATTADFFRRLDIKGDIKALLVNAKLENFLQSLRFQSRVENLSLQATNPIPKIENIDRMLMRGGIAKGKAIFQTQSAEVFLPNFFDNSFEILSAKGTMFWFVNIPGQQLLLGSKKTQLQMQDGNVLKTSFHLKTPFDIAVAKKTKYWQEPKYQLDFTVTSKEVQLKTLHKYLPKSVPGIKDFLQSFVISGISNDLVLSFNQFITEKNRTNIQLLAAIEGGEYRFLEGWPIAKPTQGRVSISNNSIKGYLKELTIANLTSRDVRFTLFEKEGDKLSNDLHLTTNIETDTSEIWRFLQTTPLHEIVGTGIDSVAPKGYSSAEIALTVPIEDIQDDSQDLFVDIVANLFDNTITVPAAELGITNVNGVINYKNGVFADNLDGLFWNKPISIQIDTEDYIVIDLDTTVDARDLENYFSELYLLRKFEGIAPMSANLHIPFEVDANSKFFIQSDLEGIAIDLPFGYAKQKNQIHPLHIELEFEEEQIPITINFKEIVSNRMILDYDNNIIASSISLGASAQYELQKGQFLVNGLFENIDFEEALDFLDILSPPEIPTIEEENGKVGGLAPMIQIQSKNFIISDDYSLQGATAFITSTDDAWLLNIKHADIDGSVSFYYDEDKPYNVDLDYYHYPIEFPAGTSTIATDPLIDLHPQDFPTMTVTVKKVKLGDFDLGSISANVEHITNGIKIDNIQNEHSQFKGNIPTEFFWHYRDGKHSSNVFYDVEIGNVEPLLYYALETPNLMASTKSKSQGQLAWSGSPLFFNVETLEGFASFEFINGSIIEIPNSAKVGSSFLNFIDVASWFRRFKLGFTGIFKNGAVFENIQGRIQFNHSIVSIIDPVTVKMPSTFIALNGSANLADETMDAEMDIVLPLVPSTAILAGALVNLPTALALYLIRSLFYKSISKLSEVTYTMTGSLDDPTIKLKSVKKKKKKKKKKSS